MHFLAFLPRKKLSGKLSFGFYSGWTQFLWNCFLIIPSSVHVKIFIVRIYEANKFLKKKARGQPLKNAEKLSVKIDCFCRLWHIAWSQRALSYWVCLLRKHFMANINQTKVLKTYFFLRNLTILLILLFIQGKPHQ